MNLTWSEVHEHLCDSLGEKEEAVSGEAFDRNGNISRLQRGNLQLHRNLNRIDKSYRTKTASKYKCSICYSTPPTTFFEAVKATPFRSPDSRFRAVDTATHKKEPCQRCGKTARIKCRSCNGNGRVPCRECDSSGKAEYRNTCPECQGDNSVSDCPTCNGTGKVWETEPCASCGGMGHEECPECRGDGTEECPDCNGHRYQHVYDEIYYDAIGSIDILGLPDDWEPEPHQIGQAIQWQQDEVTVENDGNDAVNIHSTNLQTGYIDLSYGSTDYRALLIVREDDDVAVVWSPETGFPETSIRRKFGDLRSRFSPF